MGTYEMNIPIYKAEIEAGIAEAVNKNSIIISSVLKPSDISVSQANIKIPAEASSFDLYSLNTILVTTGWNKNYDIFPKYDTWAARHTPVDKPLNINHDHTKIVGHITSCAAIDAEGKPLTNDLALDDVPDFFHILTSAVLYRALKDEVKELRQEIETIIAEIAEGKWFVSMECLFQGFDYGMSDANEQTVVARTQDTAFLTKYLSAYGGSGVYQGKKIGRVLRNITFSGKGLVKNPANPYSIIIAEEFKPRGDDMKPEELEKKVETLESKLDEAKASERKFKNDMTEANEKVEILTKKLASSEAEKTKVQEDDGKKDKKLKDSEAEIKILTETIATLTSEKDKLTKDLAESVLMFNKMDKDTKSKARKDAAKVKMDDTEADAFLKKFEKFDDATFAEILNLVPKKEVKDEKVTTAELNQKVETAGAGAVAGADAVEVAKASKEKLSKELRSFFKVKKEETK